MFPSGVMLVLVLLGFGFFVAAVAVAALGHALMRPPRMTDGKAVWVLKRLSPGDLGMKFEDVAFNIRDRRNGRPLRIAGWWIPHEGADGRCVVLLHGYADAKVGAIAWAPLWRSLGFNILAIDLRAHGYSDGTYCTAGFFERDDVNQVLDQLRAERAAETTQVVLFGASLGAATAAATAALRDDLPAVVLESPPADFRHTAMAHMDLLGAPGRIFQVMALWLSERVAGCRFSAVRPVNLVKQIACPVMIIAPEEDPLVNEADRGAVEQSLQSRGREADVYWSVKSGHLGALQAQPDLYEQRLREFLAGASCSRAPAVGSATHPAVN